FTEVFEERFGDRLNKAIDSNKMDQRDFHRSLKVLEELQRVADRTVNTDARLLFMDNQLAKEYSILFENKEVVQPVGAWSIAVKGTAPRHGFGHVPCAEFMSEVLRQAYQRAGHKFTVDFNQENDNYLIWHRTAAVVRLADALFAAGWVPWELAKYKPMIGAFMMHKHATTPGHTYMAAGLDGQFIMDNGSPLGRDLRVSNPETVRLLYRTGVFFLPPGVNPEKW
ncbi:hypothetical protein N9N67_12375, partial [Bacteriovoracaceae bacterium]|nr:hypothetical protein [Bacteriovoracaceae bacterium]